MSKALNELLHEVRKLRHQILDAFIGGMFFGLSLGIAITTLFLDKLGWNRGDLLYLSIFLPLLYLPYIIKRYRS